MNDRPLQPQNLLSKRSILYSRNDDWNITAAVSLCCHRTLVPCDASDFLCHPILSYTQAEVTDTSAILILCAKREILGRI